MAAKNGFLEKADEVQKAVGGAIEATAARLTKDLTPYFNAGLQDLQSAVVHAFPDSQHQASVLGTAGHMTPGQVDDLKQDNSFEAEVQQAAEAAKTDRSPERGIEMDRE